MRKSPRQTHCLTLPSLPLLNYVSQAGPCKVAGEHNKNRPEGFTGSPWVVARRYQSG